jgi:hypothetical protein
MAPLFCSALKSRILLKTPAKIFGEARKGSYIYGVNNEII